MKQYIEFKPQDALLPTYLRFSITKGAFEKISNHPKGIDNMFSSLSKSLVLLITKGKDEGLYEIYTNDGTYLCKISDDANALLILGFYNNTLIKQNNAMKNGICFRISAGIIIQIKLTAYNYFYDIVNGQKYQNNAYEKTHVRSSIMLIEERMAQANIISYEEDELAIEKYHPEKKLARLLQMAENYSILSSELEEKNANSVGKLSYYSIKSLEYDRVDRVVYQFVVDSIDEKIFKKGTQVDIEDKNYERHSAEIIEIDKEEGKNSVDLLFNEHIDIKNFSKIGWIALSFSTVNKEVQLAANEKIKTNEAAAKYMDIVLGKNSAADFENKDLSGVTENLLKKKYPPNESQINAICSGICAKDVFMVMGPPGTGKTTVILEWVKYFVKHEHKRVLVSSQNNKAVDNVLARIADEKDIDIIRIGSESKLQSEVIPYMFENKIKTLSDQIVERTTSNIDIIKDIPKSWINFSIGLDLVIKLNGETQELKEKVEDIISKELIPLYNEAVQYYSNYNNLRKEILSLEEKLNKTIDKVTSYENQKNKIIKIFSTVPNFIRNNIARRYISKYENLKNEEDTVVNKYNDIYANYATLYSKVKDNEFTRYYEKMMACDNTIENVEAITPKDENKWNLFKDIKIDKNLWKDNNVLKYAKNMIETEKERANNLIEAIASWKTEIESKQNYALNEIVLESVDLVGATCIGINSQKRFANLDFDVTIIDEAGQIQVHNALVPMSVSNKLIMLGDHKQIPPTADQELLQLCDENNVETELLEKSLFEKMYNEIPEDNKIMLDTQYRMPSQIADTISEWFYHGKYLSAEFKSNLKSQIPKISKETFVIIDTSKELNREEVPIYQAGSNNPLEADIIADLVNHISSMTHLDMKEIGVISAYKSQVKLIREKLNKYLTNNLVNEMVATLDSYQGQERDIIIYSFTKSSKISVKHRRIGFLNELRRLNVAMTRCKKMLILIGDMDFLSSCEHMDTDDCDEMIYEKSEKQFSDFIKKVIEDVNNGRGEIIRYKEFKERMKERG